MEILDSPTGPLEVQLVTPLTPLIAQVPSALGAVAPTGPVTVAVNEIVDPRLAVPSFAVTETTGAALPTVVTNPVIPAVEE